MLTKILATIFIISLVATIIICLRLPADILEFVGFTLVILLILSTVSTMLFFGLMGKEQYLQMRSKRIKAENEARITSTPHSDYYHPTKDTEIVPLKGLPLWRVNGHHRELTPDEKEFAALQHRQPVALLSQPATTEPLPDLLPILDEAERVLVKGPSGAGKTTLFQNIANRSQNVIVVDPHFAPGIWPEHCKIIGVGRNHQEITIFFDWLSSELDRRYKLRAEGNEDYPNLTIIIDEWMSIANKCDNASSVITEMITESRKSKMRLFIGSHSDQVEALGIRGQGKLREGLLIIRLDYDQFTGQRNATFDYGKGPRPCKVPHYVQPLLLTSGKPFELPELKTPDFIIEKRLNDKELRILEMLQQGASNKEIGQEVYSVDYPSGNQLYTINRLRKSLE